jgi:tubulin--tyrosine ligase
VNLWIIKPGENTNRGNGIEVSSSLSEIRKMVSTREFRRGGKLKTYISNFLLKIISPGVYSETIAL